MNRFMIRDIFDFMQWMLNLRTYDFKIQFNIIFENHVDWIKNEIVYKQIQFNMSNFREIFHDFMTRNKRLLFEKLLFNVVEFNFDVEFFFKIFWSRFRNNFVDEQNEWNFFQNLRNDWNIDDFIKWLWKKIEKLEKHKNFVKNHNNQFQWQHNDISKYMKHVIDFREKLLIFMHFIDDQLARVSKILNVRHRNIVREKHRNIFVENDIIVFVIRNHKNYSLKKNVKIIHRYLFQKIVILLIYYFFLILSFQQKFELIIWNKFQIFSFLWTLNSQKRAFTSKRMRHCIKREIEFDMKIALIIQMYREINIVMNRRWVREQNHFVLNEKNENEKWNENDEKKIANE